MRVKNTCDGDCFNCPYDDCIVSEKYIVDHFESRTDYEEQKEADKTLLTEERKKRRANCRDYYHRMKQDPEWLARKRAYSHEYYLRTKEARNARRKRDV